MVEPSLSERIAMRGLLDQLPTGIVLRDGEGRLVMLNRAAREILGADLTGTMLSDAETARWKLTDASGRPLASAEHPARVAAAGREVCDYVMSILRPDGTRVWVNVNAVPVDDPALGRASLTIFGDITRRYEAEQAAVAASGRAEQAVSILQTRHEQQLAIAELGRLALVGTAPQQLMEHAVGLVASVLKADYVRVLERLPEGHHLLMRAGVGWRTGLVGTATISLDNTQVGYLFDSNEPLIIEDFATDTRFQVSWLLQEHPVKSGIRAVIRGESGPFGELAAYTKAKRDFSDEDTLFMRAIANTLAEAFIRFRTEEAKEEVLRQLQEVDRERERLLERLTNVIEEERARIAADIHDDALQVLAGLAMRLQVASARAAQPDQKGLLKETSATLNDAGRRLRRLVFDLRPDVLEVGLAPALRFYFDQTATGSDPQLIIDGELAHTMPAQPLLLLYRACQEALNNIRKHARASRVTIRISETADGAYVGIADDGVGFDPTAASQPGHLGLIAMREKIQLAGGRFSIASEAQRGTTVEFWIPRP